MVLNNTRPRISRSVALRRLRNLDNANNTRANNRRCNNYNY